MVDSVENTTVQVSKLSAKYLNISSPNAIRHSLTRIETSLKTTVANYPTKARGLKVRQKSKFKGLCLNFTIQTNIDL